MWKFFLCASVGFGIFFLDGEQSSFAQVPLSPGRILLPPRIPETVPTPSPLPEPSLEITPAEPIAPPEPGTGATITVARFEFDGNTAFSDGALAKILEPFTQRPITFAELLGVETALTNYYIEAGYVNSGAVIPAGQSFSPTDAVIRVQIIEGNLEDIQVQVEGRLHPNYVKDRLAIATGQPFNRNRLLEALQLLQLNPLIQSISADLTAGSSPESSLLMVTVKEADTFTGSVFTDNSRVKSIGSWQRGLNISHGNILGWGDSGFINYANTDGSNAVSGSYTLPLNPTNGTLQGTAQYTNTNVIEAPFDQLDIGGDSLYLDLTYRQPVLQTPTQEVALGVTASYASSKTSLLGEGFPLSPGADPNGETEIGAIRFSQEWTQRGANDVLSLFSRFSVGTGLLGSTVSERQPDGEFFNWRGQGQYVRLLAPETLMVFRSALQLSTEPLVPLEQIALGGLYTVRGYRQDFFLTDNGLLASLEFRLPILRIDEIGSILHLVPFTDLGVGWNDSGNPLPTPNPNTLWSVGLGLMWQMNDRLSARLDWGLPLTRFEGEGGNTLSQQSLYFSVNMKLF